MMRHRAILMHEAQQAAYLTNREKAQIAERRQANRKNQHNKEHTFENAHKKPQKESAKNLAGAPMPRADNHESTTTKKKAPKHI